MLIKTVVDETVEGASKFESYCRKEGEESFERIELHLAETEYDDAFAESILGEISEYCIHTKYVHDYESSSDAGDGRDDYYVEEDDLPITLNECIIKDNKFFGVVCECFERKGFLLTDCYETILSHPGNYGGRNYHYYREKYFKLTKKI